MYIINLSNMMPYLDYYQLKFNSAHNKNNNVNKPKIKKNTVNTRHNKCVSHR